ncbi:MAG: hypothetical protein KGR26_08055, partial [Cyanobacteria bacterium REEB65]|nr:hypothetical protein [Cyanobacteria bacterium REEB65]
VGARLGRLEDALAKPDPAGLPVIRGELRQQGRAYLLPDVASARMPIKQQNAELQDLWERSVEPLLAHRVLAKSPMPLGFWREGWELILKNQPHDSICGCSIDEVHREMQARFSQARSLGQDLVARCLDAFAPRHPDPGLMIFNPSCAEREGWVELVAEAPPQDDPWDSAHLEGLPTVFLGAEPGEEFYADIDYHPDWKPVVRYRFLAYLGGLPPFGLAHYRLSRGPGTPSGAPAEVQSGENWLENAKLRVEVVEGRIQLTHKPTGQIVRDLLRWVDGGDAGDEYTYSPPEDDRLKMASLKDYELVESTPARAVMTIVHEMAIPAALAPDRKSRALLQVTTTIRTRITLHAGEDAVRFAVALENWAQDHRLRALIGTGMTAPEHLAAEAAFGAVERHVSTGLGSLPVPPLGEAIPPTFPHLGWVAAEGPDLAMQLLAPGLPEAEFVHGGSAVAITVLRCVGWLSRDDLRTRGGGAGPHLQTPDAQLEGAHAFGFAARFDRPAAPGRRAWWDALGDLDLLRHLPRSQATGGHRQPFAGGLEPRQDWLSPVPTAALLSALKPASDGHGVVVRAFNPTDEPRAFPLLAPPDATCQPCDLAETPLGDPTLRCEAILEPGTIRSFRIAGKTP